MFGELKKSLLPHDRYTNALRTKLHMQHEKSCASVGGIGFEWRSFFLTGVACLACLSGVWIYQDIFQSSQKQEGTYSVPKVQEATIQ